MNYTNNIAVGIISLLDNQLKLEEDKPIENNNLTILNYLCSPKSQHKRYKSFGYLNSGQSKNSTSTYVWRRPSIEIIDILWKLYIQLNDGTYLIFIKVFLHFNRIPVVMIVFLKQYVVT